MTLDPREQGVNTLFVKTHVCGIPDFLNCELPHETSLLTSQCHSCILRGSVHSFQTGPTDEGVLKTICVLKKKKTSVITWGSYWDTKCSSESPEKLFVCGSSAGCLLIVMQHWCWNKAITFKVRNSSFTREYGKECSRPAPLMSSGSIVLHFD